MENKEKYYRRAFNCLSTLENAYKNGYSISSINKFISDEKKKNPKIAYEEQESLRLTIIVALLGLNKERLEKTDKLDNYQNIIDNYDIRNVLSLPKNIINIIKDFDNKNTVNTKYDSFLSVINNLAPNYTDEDYINTVRNAFLHGQYELDLNDQSGIITKIKNKGFIECEVLNPNLYYFINSYFSNLPTLGVTEKNVLYAMENDIKIKNELELQEFLNNYQLQYIEYDNASLYDGENTLEKKLADKFGAKYIDSDVVESHLNKYSNSDINITSIDKKNLEQDIIECVIEKIKLDYGTEFYKKTPDEQKNIISCYVEYFAENSRMLSNWLLHYFYLVSRMNEVDISFFMKDEDYNFSSEISLLIVKAYLVLFRLQGRCFEEVSYSDIDLDINDLQLSSFDENDNPANLFIESFNKLRNKPNNTYTEDEIKKVVLNEVIRDALAHGNVETRFELDSNGELKHTITLKDIYKSKKRIIKMDINTFKKYLNSKAFYPEKCIMKDKGTSKVKTI